MRALVTGAGGFVGSVLTKHLISRGIPVRAMVRNPKQLSMVEEWGAEAVLADLNDPTSLALAVKDVDRVFHIAALFRQAGLPSSEFFRVNVEGTKNLIECGIAAGVKNFVHCSTVGVHGHVMHPPANEGTPYNPGDAYQESKVEGEKLFLEYVRSGKIQGSVIRPAMIYGPHDDRTFKLFDRIARRRFFYVGPGTSLVHFVDVRDLAHAFYLASERLDINGEIFIVAGDTSLPLVDAVKIIASLMGVTEPWLHLPIRPMQMVGTLCEALCTPLHINPPIFRRRVDFFTKDRNFNCAKARQVLGYQPSRSFVEELIDIIASYVADGRISRTQIRKPSAMLRSLDGLIHSWDDDARRVYGWSKDQAIGSISHSLLKTQFPQSLAEINHSLEVKGYWKGYLIHKGRDGRELQAKSTWKLLQPVAGVPPMVLELNEAVNDDSRNSNLVSVASACASAISTFEPVLIC